MFLLLLFYALVAVLMYAKIFGYWQGHYSLIAKKSYWFDFFISIFFALSWPISIFCLTLSKGWNYPMKWK